MSAIADVSDTLGDTLANTDGRRQFATRRVAVDALVDQQTLDGLQALRGARAQIQLQLTLGGLTQDEQALTEDLLARVEEAMNPYFDA